MKVKHHRNRVHVTQNAADLLRKANRNQKDAKGTITLDDIDRNSSIHSSEYR